MPRDGDIPGHGSEEQLVAEIIPLRRRASQRPDVEQRLAGEQAMAACALTGERSVWEPPSGELRRRIPPKRLRAAAVRRALGRHGFRGVLAVAALGLCVASVVLLLGLAPTHPAARRTSEMRGNVASTSNGKLAQQHSARSEDRGDRGSHAKHHGSSRAKVTKQARRPRGPDLAGRQSTAGSASLAVTHSQVSTVSSQPTVPQPAASSAAASDSTAQSECVPGELGC